MSALKQKCHAKNVSIMRKVEIKLQYIYAQLITIFSKTEIYWIIHSIFNKLLPLTA